MYQRRNTDHGDYRGGANRRQRRKNKKNLLPALICILLAIALIITVVLIMHNRSKDPYEKLDVSTETTSATSENANVTVPQSQMNTNAETTAPPSKETENLGSENTTAKAQAVDVGLSDESTDPSSWNLKLVNLSSPKLAADYVPSLGTVDGYYVRSDIVEPTKKLMAAAKADGIRLFIVSGYRSYQTQTELFNNRVAMYQDGGMSYDDAYKKASMVNAVPGTSEHQLGLAIDFNSLDQSFGETAEGKWLYNNAWKYGFIFRYPKESVGVTGIMYEPWHYRYVGVNNAKIMHDKGMTLEDYIGYLNGN